MEKKIFIECTRLLVHRVVSFYRAGVVVVIVAKNSKKINLGKQRWLSKKNQLMTREMVD
jgi:hypothetical protein